MSEPKIIDADRIEREIEAEVRSIGYEIQDDARRNLRENKTNASFILRDSITLDMRRRGMDIVVNVGPHASYGAYVEFGTKPHWPPRTAIRDWINEKFRGRIRGKEADRFAFLVSRKIAAFGTKGKPYMVPAYKKHEPTVTSRVMRAIDRGLR